LASGAPFMRALPLDFPNDPKVADLRDEYMFGPAFLVAPVTEQGATSREVYLPAGADWYNYWTNERVKGGQTIRWTRPSTRCRCSFGRVHSAAGRGGGEHASGAGD
jgi:alpha-D-xyloside xylohydrolase